MHWLAENGLVDDVQVFQLSILPGTAFRREAAELGLVHQDRPPYAVLRTPTLDLETMRRLVEEAEDVFATSFDPLPEPWLERPVPESTGGVPSWWAIDLDRQHEGSPPVFAAQVDRLPFRRGDVVVGLGDSITDDDQSWLEILRHLLEIRRPQDDIKVVNAGVSGDTTSQMITRFLDVVLDEPDWIICMAGTNDARLHGQSPTKVLVSVEETEKNLAMLRNFAATQTTARWVWMTPATVIEEQIADHWFFWAFEQRWRNEDLAAIADVVRRQPEPVVDLQAVFGVPADPTLLLPDGLHPSLAGQKAIVTVLVETLTS